MKSKIIIGAFALLFFLSFANFVSAEGEIVGTAANTVCCEKTKSGLFCQNVLREDCLANSRQPPTSCESTQFCNPGFCYDSGEGTCLDNVPQEVCTTEGGIWSAEKPAACDLGCCVLGDQASFVTLVRCKRLSNFYGLETNYDTELDDEIQCILTARSDEMGACVFEKEFETTCKMTKREDCTADKMIGNVKTETQTKVIENNSEENSSDVLQSPGVRFHPGKLCTAEEFGTNCGPSEQTRCVEGKEEVYFVDTCGNLANIYDASKVKNDAYWTDIIDKKDSCNSNSANENSQTCGNCNYLLGSFCRDSNKVGVRATYGTNICADLNCYDNEANKERIHGESWCAFDVKKDFVYKENTAEQSPFTGILSQALQGINSGRGTGTQIRGADAPVGSKFYRKVCIHGEIITEPCADFRQEECIENVGGGFTEAACRVNRWQDCTAQYTKLNCENQDRRDCVWMPGKEYVLMGSLMQEGNVQQNSLANAGTNTDAAGKPRGILKQIQSGERELGACVPKTPPGLKFWEGNDAATTALGQAPAQTEAMTICSQANAECPVKYEKKISGGDWECVENCECLAKETEAARAQLCMALGDCGPKVNIVGGVGRGNGYKLFNEKLDSK